MASGVGGLSVDVRQLREAVSGLLGQIEAEHGPLVAVDRDNYWLVELQDAFDFGSDAAGTPVGLGVGQLSDDVESVDQTVRSLRADGRVVSPWHDLEHAVGLLRALAWLDLP
ncbi:hypothetical protein [Micromonospora zhanjiangensis]|uniref:Uncharacterized protein n=1 Tax=Micromonospora zhanjiangensis TaxID=1522057 RepID=A0ABV8KS22_9ACTN